MYTADSLTLDLLSLGRDGHGLISVIGDVEWKCRDVGPGSPLAFKTVSTHLCRVTLKCRRNQIFNPLARVKPSFFHPQASFYEAQKQQQGGVISFTREEAFLVS